MKNVLRKEILGIRNKLNKEYVINASEEVFKHLKTMDVFRASKHVMVYVSFKNEVSTQLIMSHLLSNNKQFLVPYTNKRDCSMTPALISNLDDLSVGNYGILEPAINKADQSYSSLIDLVIVPGIAFDLSGNRIGFGKGYYDFFLSQLNGKIPIIALAYDFQIKNKIPSEPHDIKMDYIISPTRIIRSP